MDVRVMAAAHLLRYRTAEAKAVLEDAAKGSGGGPSGRALVAQQAQRVEHDHSLGLAVMEAA